MLPTTNYQEILDYLQSDMEFRRREGSTVEATMCGILFARPESDLAAKEVFPQLGYFEELTREDFHIFTAGCFKRSSAITFGDQRPAERNGNWLYSDQAFNSMRCNIEAVSSWKYRHGVELLLVNATRNRRNGIVSIDFHSAIWVELEKMRESAKFKSIAELIAQLAEHNRVYLGDNPARGFSTKMGKDIVRSAVWDFLVGLLPEAIRLNVNQAKLFIIQDLSIPKSQGELKR